MLPYTSIISVIKEGVWKLRIKVILKDYLITTDLILEIAPDRCNIDLIFLMKVVQ